MPPEIAPTEQKIVRTEEEWRQILDPDQYRILRQQGTEPAFSGKYWETKTPGVYLCAGCGQQLFDSQTKYDSGSGWPSFWAPLDPGRLETETDRSYGMARNEVHCSRCGAHLGHVFSDGPQPTGQRYCMNSASLKLEERKESGDRNH